MLTLDGSRLSEHYNKCETQSIKYSKAWEFLYRQLWIHVDRFSKWVEVRKNKWPNQRPMNIPFLKVPCQPFNPNWDGDPTLDLEKDIFTNSTSKHVFKKLQSSRI